MDKVVILRDRDCRLVQASRYQSPRQFANDTLKKIRWQKRICIGWQTDRPGFFELKRQQQSLLVPTEWGYS